jgi:pimeloyl-ACP methyl ester carboxylesterase
MAPRSQTIVFIHGMYMTPLCWEHWIPWFETRGYRCSAPGWPGREENPPALSARHPDPKLASFTLSAVVDHLAGVISALPEKPVLIGHSMGGLVAQLLLQKGKAAAAVHTLSVERQRAVFERYVVPESRRIPRQSLTAAARVNFKKPHDPLLFIAGSKDRIIPASLNRRNHRRYSDAGSITALREFPDRTHFIIGQENWEEVEGFIASWLEHPTSGMLRA